MSVPANISFATAINLGTIPAAYEEAAFDTATTYDLYFRFTVPANTFAAWVYARGDDLSPSYDATAHIYNSDETLLRNGAANTPLQFPVLPGSYYLVVTAVANANPSNLTLELVPHTTQPITQDGAIFVPNDTTGVEATLISATTSNVILRFVNPFPAGEAGDSLFGEHPFILQYDEGPDQVVVVDPSDFSEVTRYAVSAGKNLGEQGIRTNRGRGSIYYLEYDESPPDTATLHEVTFDGTTATRTSTVLTNLLTAATRFAVSNDGSIIYFSRSGTGGEIERYDVTNQVMLSDLAAGVTNYQATDILVLDDGSIVPFTFSNFGIGVGRLRAKRYDPDGTLRNIYDFGLADNYAFPGGTNPRIFYDSEPGIFWVWTHLPGEFSESEGISRFQKIRASDGEILLTLTFREYELGLYVDGATTPGARFGLSFSCPAYLLPPVAVADDEDTPVVIIDNSLPCCDANAVGHPCDCTSSSGPSSGSVSTGSTSSQPPSTSTGPILPVDVPLGPVDILSDAYWDQACEGGGAVPMALDPVDSENWVTA